MVLGAAFIYHFDYELGIRKLAEFIDHINRLFFAAHLYVGYTIGIEDISFESNVAYRHRETGEVISVGAHETLARERQQALSDTMKRKEKIQELYDIANEKIRVVTEAFFTKTIEEDLPDEYFKEHSRHWVTYNPQMWMELSVAEATKEFDKAIIKLAKEVQGTANQMAVAVVSWCSCFEPEHSANVWLLQTGTSRGSRLMSGIKVGRLLAHFSGGYSVSGTYEQKQDPDFEPIVTKNEPDYSGEAFGFNLGSYATGFSPRQYFLGSAAGRRVMMESSMGAIQKSGYLEHRLKRASENLMIDDRGYLMNTRLGKVLSLQVGEDGLQPFHARGPDNPVELHFHFSHTFWQRSVSTELPSMTNVTCVKNAKCPKRPQARSSTAKYCVKIDRKNSSGKRSSRN